MFNLLITLMTLIAAAFVVAWFLRPDFRRWIEEPKYRLLEQEKRFANAAREQQPARIEHPKIAKFKRET